MAAKAWAALLLLDSAVDQFYRRCRASDGGLESHGSIVHWWPLGLSVLPLPAVSFAFAVAYTQTGCARQTGAITVH